MKIIHIADLHLDSLVDSRLLPYLQKERLQELVSNFANVCDYANRLKVDKIIISGDLFDSDNFTSKTKDQIIDSILKNPDIEFLFVASPNDKAFVASLDILPSNLKLFDNEFYTLEYDNVTITGINYKNSYDYDALELLPNKINIVMMYGDTETEINLAKLKNKNINYLALGGVHKYESDKLDSEGVYVYPGMLEANNVSEIGNKGFVLININDDLNYEFIPFAKRIAYDIKFDITNLETLFDVKRSIQNNLSEVKEADMLTLRLIGGYSLDTSLNLDEISQYLSSEYYYVNIIDETHLNVNPKDYENDISFKGEFIRKVMASDLTDEEKSKIIEYGIRALLKEAL